MPTTEGQVVSKVISDKLVCEKSLFLYMQDMFLTFSKSLCVCNYRTTGYRNAGTPTFCSLWKSVSSLSLCAQYLVYWETDAVPRHCKIAESFLWPKLFDWV